MGEICISGQSSSRIIRLPSLCITQKILQTNQNCTGTWCSLMRGMDLKYLLILLGILFSPSNFIVWSILKRFFIRWEKFSVFNSEKPSEQIIYFHFYKQPAFSTCNWEYCSNIGMNWSICPLTTIFSIQCHMLQNFISIYFKYALPYKSFLGTGFHPHILKCL